MLFSYEAFNIMLYIGMAISLSFAAAPILGGIGAVIYIVVRQIRRR